MTPNLENMLEDASRDELIKLIKDSERYSVTTKPDLECIGKDAMAALGYLDDGDYDSTRDMIIAIHGKIYPNAWQPVEG